MAFNYFETGAQTSDMLNMSQFHKISITKCSHRERTEQLLGFPDSYTQIHHIAIENMPNNINKCLTLSMEIYPFSAKNQTL